MNLDVEMASEMVRLQQENTILKKVLELACEKFIRDEVGMLTDTELYDYFIEQAKESIDEQS